MKRIIIVIAAILAVLLVMCIGLIFGGLYWYQQTTLEFVEESTNISFPDDISQVDVYDNGEYFVTTHVKLTPEKIPSFINDHKFQAVSTEVSTFTTNPIQELAVWIGHLEPENRLLPTDGLVFVEGCSEYNRWIHVLDEESGRLWSIVFYPDMSGDPPACKDKIN